MTGRFTQDISRTWSIFFVVVGMLLIQVVLLYSFGQPTICTCDRIDVWAGEIFSSDNSQHITDWYTFSHILHGLLFYVILHLLFPRVPWMYRLLIAVGIEVAWEVVENTPAVIDHYRQSALAQGYTGDSIINSLSDTLSMIGGFVFARVVPVWLSIVVFLVFELGTLYFVRDNLILNVINLTYSVEAIQEWQVQK